MKGPKHLVLLLLILSLLVSACQRNPLKVDISDIKTEAEVVPFGEKLFNIEGTDTLEAIAELSNEYPDFFNLFTYRIIRIGGMGDENFPELMKAFITDTLIREVKAKTDSVFNKPQKLEKELIKAFKYFAWHFPDKEIPTIYTYISGFNQSIVTAENLIGISLDKYLGRDCKYYQQLSTTPQYKIMNMHKDRIVPEVAYAWALTEFEDPNSATNLLDNIVQKGKLMYLVDAMLPDTPDSLKIGYTGEQLNWCKMNELAMWTYLIEHKMLYSNKRMDIVRYINDAPTTSGFPLESPGRTGVWIGWQIVRQYMKKHPEVTLEQLMKNKDHQKILNESEYDPG
jgi:gliding motility-associated lipoprotein GldB